MLGPDGSCTGTLIAPDVVLTAGHCAEAHPTRVVADTVDYNQAGGQTVRVKSITAYPHWATTYDVSVIVLEQPITGITPRAVGTSCSFDGFHADMMVHLVGFGATDEQGQVRNTQLREASAPVVDPDCSDGEGCVAAVAPGGEFVAGGDGTDSCFGDSGGPVYLDTPRGTIVVAAVSRGIDGAHTACGDGGIYVRTDKVVKWIEDTTGRVIAKDSCAGDEEQSGTAPGGEGDDGEDGAVREGAANSGGCAAGGGATGGLFAGVMLLLSGFVRYSDKRPKSGRTARAK